MISSKQMRKMGGHREPDADDRGGRSDGDQDNRGKRTKAEPSKMASFGDRSKVDAHNPKRGASVATGKTIDKNQRTGPMPSRGARVNKGGQPHVDAIDENQTPKFPAGATVKKNSRPVGVQGLGGTAPGLRSSGPIYGGPSSRKYG
jgi:hypothetical protein